MFITEHLEGRLLYETNEIVCINVFVNRAYSNGQDVFLTQLLFSLVNGNFVYHNSSFSVLDGPNITCDKFDKEVKEGMDIYIKARKSLGLST